MIMKNIYTIKNLPGEIWKEIKGFPFYEVSTKGRIKRIVHEKYYYKDGTIRFYSEKLMTLTKDSKGYLTVGLYANGKRFTLRVNRLVAIAFIPNPLNLPDVNHLNENKADNSVENLAWASSKFNSNWGTRNDRIANKNRGVKKTPEQMKKRLESSAKKVICEGVIYDAIAYCAKHYCIPANTMSCWINGVRAMPQKYKDMGLKFADNKKTMRYKQFNDIVIYDGIFDVNIVDAMLQTNKNLIFLNINDLKDSVSMLIDGSGKLISFKRIYNKYFA